MIFSEQGKQGKLTVALALALVVYLEKIRVTTALLTSAKDI